MQTCENVMFQGQMFSIVREDTPYIWIKSGSSLKRVLEIEVEPVDSQYEPPQQEKWQRVYVAHPSLPGYIFTALADTEEHDDGWAIPYFDYEVILDIVRLYTPDPEGAFSERANFGLVVNLAGTEHKVTKLWIHGEQRYLFPGWEWYFCHRDGRPVG